MPNTKAKRIARARATRGKTKYSVELRHVRVAQERKTASARVARSLTEQFDEALRSGSPNVHLISPALSARAHRVYVRWSEHMAEIFLDELSGDPEAAQLFSSEDIQGLARHICERAGCDAVKLVAVKTCLHTRLETEGWRNTRLWWDTCKGDYVGIADEFVKTSANLRVAAGGDSAHEQRAVAQLIEASDTRGRAQG